MNNYYDSGRSRKVAGRGKRNRILAIASLVLAGLVIISYLAPVFYFLGHFQANTTINGDDVSYMTVKQVEELITKAEAVYSLKVTGRDGIETTLTTEDIEMKPVFNGSINELLKKQNKFLWPLSFKKKSEYTEDSVCEYSEEKMKEALKASDFFNTALQKQPENAYYEFGETKYEIVPDVPGNVPDEEKVYTAVSKALDVLDESVDLDKENCYKKAEIDRDNETLNLTVDNLNKYCGVSLFFDFGETSETLDGTIIKDWVSLDGTTATFDSSHVKEYVDGLAKRHDTFGLNREFKTSKGKTITVSGGDFGWWTDRPSTTQAIITAIENGESGEMEPVYFGRGAVHGDSDIGNSYVEVDLDNQHVYVYKDGALVVESDCVSGKAINGNSTPEGTYGITYKERDAELVGENYTSPVKYWMPFNGNVGLHDASWRKQFGGDIYVRSGSHGCVNLPTAKAEQIFDAVTKGEPVIVYGGLKKSDVVKEDKTEEEQLQQLLLQMALSANQAAQQQNAGDQAAQQQAQGDQAAGQAAQ